MTYHPMQLNIGTQLWNGMKESLWQMVDALPFLHFRWTTYVIGAVIAFTIYTLWVWWHFWR